MNGNGKLCAQEKIKNKQKIVVQRKDSYYDAINKYLQEFDDQRSNLLIIREEAIENYKAFKKLYTNENSGLTVIGTSLEENTQDSEMTQGENIEVVKYDKRKKYYDWSDKTLRTYKDKDKTKDKSGIISKLSNETNNYVDTTLEVNGE